jgi:serine/threonine protein phosphatase 1
MKRTIVIGDIHGCYDELRSLLTKLGFSEDDRVVAVGDLTVKGPKNREVLELFSTDGRFSSVIGNHDLALVRHWRNCAAPLKPSQLRAFEELKQSDHDLFSYLDSLPSYIELDSHIVVHAGLRPGIDPEHQSLDDLVELRTLGPDRTSRDGKPWYEEYEGIKTALFGHWPSAIPRRGQYAIGLDTGCVYGYQLTAYIIEENRFVTVDAKTEYTNPNGRSRASN